MTHTFVMLSAMHFKEEQRAKQRVKEKRCWFVIRPKAHKFACFRRNFDSNGADRRLIWILISYRTANQVILPPQLSVLRAHMISNQWH
jgi:hypothetical protein